MIRGTTPTLTFDIPLETTLIDALYITFAQGGENVVEKTIDDVILDEKSIVLKLSQVETLRFLNNTITEIQIRLKTLSGEALASEIILIPTERILKDGEI